MEERFDADAVARVLRRAHELADERNAAGDAALDQGGVSPEALFAAADEMGIDPAAVREALTLERFATDVPAARRLDRLAGASEVAVQRTIPRGVDDTLEAIQEWLTAGYQMRCMRTDDNTIECRPRTGIGASLSRVATEFTDDEDIKPVERILVEAQPRPVDSSDDTGVSAATTVRITAFRHTTRSWRLGGAAIGGAAGVGGAVAGVAGAAVGWPIAGVGLFCGGLLIARSGNAHADRVELEMVRVLSAVARAEKPTGIAGRAARRVRAAVKSVRSTTK